MNEASLAETELHELNVFDFDVPDAAIEAAAGMSDYLGSAVSGEMKTCCIAE